MSQCFRLNKRGMEAIKTFLNSRTTIKPTVMQLAQWFFQAESAMNLIGFMHQPKGSIPCVSLANKAEFGAAQKVEAVVLDVTYFDIVEELK